MSDETMQAAMDQAYRFLAQRFLSSYELTQKMRRKQFEDPIIERVLERLRDYDYINDERLSEQVLAYLMKEQKYGAYMIKQKMKLRGLAIPQEISAYDEVKAAYRKMALKHHPDRVASLGEDIRKAAEEKFQEINAAKEAIYKARKM